MNETEPKHLRSWTVVSAVVASLLIVGPAASARELLPTASRSGPCALTRSADETVRHFSKRVIGCAAAKWTVPGGATRAICIARHESGLVPKATSPGGKYLGLFQHSATYWPRRYERWTWTGWNLRTSALSGRTNAIVAVRMAHGLGGWRRAGWTVPRC